MVIMDRCKHGMIESQCAVCSSGPSGYDGERDDNVYGDIDYLSTVPEDSVKLRNIPSNTGLSEDIIMDEVDSGTRPEREVKKMNNGQVVKKECIKCGKPKELEEFPKNKVCKDGHTNECKMCKSEKSKAARLKKIKELGKGKAKKQGKRKEETPGRASVRALKNIESIPGVVEDVIPPLSLDVLLPENDNRDVLKEAARFIIANVQKGLLGAVVDELRGEKARAES